MDDEQPNEPTEETVIPKAYRVCFSVQCRSKATTRHKQVERTQEGKPDLRLWVCLECGMRTLVLI